MFLIPGKCWKTTRFSLLQLMFHCPLIITFRIQLIVLAWLLQGSCQIQQLLWGYSSTSPAKLYSNFNPSYSPSVLEGSRDRFGRRHMRRGLCRIFKQLQNTSPWYRVLGHVFRLISVREIWGFNIVRNFISDVLIQSVRVTFFPILDCDVGIADLPWLGL